LEAGCLLEILSDTVATGFDHATDARQNHARHEKIEKPERDRQPQKLRSIMGGIKRREYAAAVSGIVGDPGLGVHSIGCAVLASSRCRLRFGGGLGKRRGHEHPDFPFNPAQSDPDGKGSRLTQTSYAKASRAAFEIQIA